MVAVEIYYFMGWSAHEISHLTEQNVVFFTSERTSQGANESRSDRHTHTLQKPRTGNTPSPYNTKSKGFTGVSLLLFNIINRRRGATRNCPFCMRLPWIQAGSVTGSNGFRRSALFIMCAGALAPGTFTTGSERVPTGSDQVHFS